MRALILLVLGTPAQAWVFTPTPVCTIAEDAPDLSIRVSFDPAQPEPYAIALTRPIPWPQTETFGPRFDGPAGMTIGTDRHQLSPDARTLTVSDTGFGNVLDGLALNRSAAAFSDGAETPFDLDGASAAVEAFRSCGVAPAS